MGPNGATWARFTLTVSQTFPRTYGSFFSQVGGRLLVLCSDMDPNLATIRQHLLVKGDWSEESFNQARRVLRKFEYQIRIRPDYLERLRTLLSDQMDFLLRLLENPVLLEHESFTDLLQAVFHLTEELASREDIQALPESDYHHLGGDVKRVYRRLSLTWLSYMIHLKKHYPYLFSLAMRKNPFDLEASAVVKS